MTKHAVLLGASRPFGSEIEARLCDDGFSVNVSADLAQPDGFSESLSALIVNSPVALEDVTFDDITDDRFRAAIDDQLYAVVAAAQVAVPRMPNGGSIVHVGSRAHLGGWGGAHQVAAAAALIGMSRSMALEFADAGIRVNCVAADFAGAPWDTPSARAELANVVAFLASPQSRMISGETLLVDDARSLRLTASKRPQAKR